MATLRPESGQSFDNRLDALSWMRLPRECTVRARWWGAEVILAITGPIAPTWLATFRWSLVLVALPPYGRIVDDVVVPCHAWVRDRQPHLLRVTLLPRLGHILTYLRRRVVVSTAGHRDVLSNITGISAVSLLEQRTIRNRLRIPCPASAADWRDREHQ